MVSPAVQRLQYVPEFLIKRLSLPYKLGVEEGGICTGFVDIVYYKIKQCQLDSLGCVGDGGLTASAALCIDKEWVTLVSTYRALLNSNAW